MPKKPYVFEFICAYIFPVRALHFDSQKEPTTYYYVRDSNTWSYGCVELSAETVTEHASTRSNRCSKPIWFYLNKLMKYLSDQHCHTPYLASSQRKEFCLHDSNTQFLTLNPFLFEPGIHRIFALGRLVTVYKWNYLNLAFHCISSHISSNFSLSSKVFVDIYHKAVCVIGYVSSGLCWSNLLTDCYMSSG